MKLKLFTLCNLLVPPPCHPLLPSTSEGSPIGVGGTEECLGHWRMWPDLCLPEESALLSTAYGPLYNLPLHLTALGAHYPTGLMTHHQ